MHSKILNLKSKILAVALLALMMGCEKGGVDKDMHGLFGWKLGEKVEGTKIGVDPRGTSGIWEIEARERVPGLTKYTAYAREKDGRIYALKGEGESASFLEARRVTAEIKTRVEMDIGYELGHAGTPDTWAVKWLNERDRGEGVLILRTDASSGPARTILYVLDTSRTP